MVRSLRSVYVTRPEQVNKGGVGGGDQGQAPGGLSLISPTLFPLQLIELS